MKRLIPFFLVLLSIDQSAQQVTLKKDQIVAITTEWKGERLHDGRPKLLNSPCRGRNRMPV